jgi:DNA mismatch repair ATPase MutS
VRVNLLRPDRDAEWRWALDAAEHRELTRTGRRFHGDAVNEKAGLPWNAEALVQDLELDMLFEAMAGEDDCAFLMARRELLCGCSNDAKVIRYRQAVLQDTLQNADLLRKLYAASQTALKQARRHYLGNILSNYPDSVLRWAVEIMEALLPQLLTVREIAEAAEGRFASDGWTRFFATCRRELSADFFAAAKDHLATLKRYDRELISAELGPGNHASNYVLHALSRDRTTRWERLLRVFTPGSDDKESLSFAVASEDENGHRALRELRNRGIAVAARALGRSACHVRDFFALLRVELSFYIGCLNLHERLAGKGEPSCMPDSASRDACALSFDGLYDPCLSLRQEERLVGNDVDADSRLLVVITGANEGGKSTFLRSVGVAQLMMQAGMFVAANAFRSSVVPAVITHFRREEDEAMRLGKFEEELERMSELIDHALPGALLLLNESFSSTYEREGSEIALQVTKGLADSGVRILFVTHLFEFARRAASVTTETLFLRADRGPAGERTFRILPGEPLNTGFAGDLYLRVFGEPLPEAAE